MLRLRAIGRRSGKERSSILGHLEDGPDLILLAMNGWTEGTPASLLNLQAHPGAGLVDRSSQVHRPLDPGQSDRMCRRGQERRAGRQPRRLTSGPILPPSKPPWRSVPGEGPISPDPSKWQVSYLTCVGETDEMHDAAERAAREIPGATSVSLAGHSHTSPSTKGTPYCCPTFSIYSTQLRQSDTAS
jgi:F420H(2)-dependent quinone reductase